MGGQQSQLIYSVPVGFSQEQYNLTEKDLAKGETLPRRKLEYANRDLAENITTPTGEKIETLQDLMFYAEKYYSKEMCLFQRDPKTNQYVGITYGEAIKYARQLGSGIKNMNLAPEKCEYSNLNLSMVGIFAKNRKEWALLDMAVYLYGLTIVPLYDTLGPESIAHCLNNSGVENMFASSPKNTSQLKAIVSFDDITDDQKQKASAKGLKLIHISEVINAGKNLIEPPKYPKEKCFTFSYTSGTTGVPKGALLNHRSFVSMISVFWEARDDVPLEKEDCHISYLPLPHLYERMLLVVLLYHGSKIYYYSGDVLKLKQDIADVKPTIFPSVPRLYSRFYDAMKKGFDSQEGVKKWLVDTALEAKIANYTANGDYTHTVWDKLVFQKTKDAFGGRVKWMCTGSAPISTDTLNFLKVCVCCPIIEGYGQTESMGASFLTRKNDLTHGHVGGPCCNIEFKLVDVPELDYRVTDKDSQGNLTPRGEVWMRGPGVFMGYYRDEEKTKETVNSEGWLASGDVGMILPNGALKIIDRKKNIFKLSQGEYVAPEKIENVYKQAKGVAEIFVHGNSLEAFLVALIVPDQDIAKTFFAENNLGEFSMEAACSNKEFEEYLMKNMQAQAKQDGLNGFEQVRKIKLEPVSLMVHGCLTNTFKLQRAQATKKFKEQLEQLYK